MALALAALADTAVGALDTAEVDGPEPAAPPVAVAGPAATDDRSSPAAARVPSLNPPLRARMPTTSPLPGTREVWRAPCPIREGQSVRAGPDHPFRVAADLTSPSRTRACRAA